MRYEQHLVFLFLLLIACHDISGNSLARKGAMCLARCRGDADCATQCFAEYGCPRPAGIEESRVIVFFWPLDCSIWQLCPVFAGVGSRPLCIILVKTGAESGNSMHGLSSVHRHLMRRLDAWLNCTVEKQQCVSVPAGTYAACLQDRAKHWHW